MTYEILVEHAANKKNTGAWAAVERCAEIRTAGGRPEIQYNASDRAYRVRGGPADDWRHFYEGPL